MSPVAHFGVVVEKPSRGCSGPTERAASRPTSAFKRLGYSASDFRRTDWCRVKNCRVMSMHLNLLSCPTPVFLCEDRQKRVEWLHFSMGYPLVGLCMPAKRASSPVPLTPCSLGVTAVLIADLRLDCRFRSFQAQSTRRPKS